MPRFFWSIALLTLTGCSTFQNSRDLSSSRVEYGRPNKVVDGIGWVMSIPEKVVLWNRKIDNHNVSAETVAATEAYLDYNGLDDVKVRVNQYDPIGEWRRLTQNHHVAAGWRYTLGTIHLIDYTLLPGRLVGGDKYNPYTNSIYIFSDVPEMPMVEAGYAKDVHGRRYPGTYAAVNDLPLANMWHESIATQDVLQYLRDEGSLDDQVSGHHLLSARYGLRAGHSLGALFGTTIALPLELGGAAIGHISGRMSAPKGTDLTTTASKSPSVKKRRFEAFPPATEKQESDIETVGHREPPR